MILLICLTNHVTQRNLTFLVPHRRQGCSSGWCVTSQLHHSGPWLYVPLSPLSPPPIHPPFLHAPPSDTWRSGVVVSDITEAPEWEKGGDFCCWRRHNKVTSTTALRLLWLLGAESETVLQAGQCWKELNSVSRTWRLSQYFFCG